MFLTRDIFFSEFSLRVNCFFSLEAIASKYISQNKDILAALETNKCYLKIGYLQNCSINNETISHCIAHALSDPENECLSKACHRKSCHEFMCEQCDLLFETINSILSITATLDSVKKADVQYDATLAENNIFKWLQHIICHAQQDKAKQDCLESLSN